MPIIQSEIKFHKSAVINDQTTNGGRMSANLLTSGAASNVFPTVGESERTNGSTKYRKIFVKVANDADLTLGDARIFLDKNTPGDDRVSFFEGTQIDTQAAISGSERQYGGGKLDGNVSPGATSIDVLVELAAAIVFVDGDLIRITDKADINSAGSEEFVTISGAPSFAGDVATITFTPALQNGYSASNTRVQSVLEVGDVKATCGAPIVTSGGSGTFNGDFLFGDAIGSIEQTWTCTFTSATVFNIVGDTVGAVGSGTVGSGASPNNPSFGKPYFVMQSTGFGGTFQSGDTIVFPTHPAAVPLWMKRVVPAGSAAFQPNTGAIVMRGETV